MKKIFYPALCALMLTACTAVPECSSGKGEIAPGVPEYTLSNGTIEIKVLTGVSGIVDHFRYLPAKRNLFEPMEYRVVTHDLLPEDVTAKVTGGRELIWGIRNFVNVPMEVTKLETTPEKTVISMKTRFFQGENVEAEKTVSLDAGTIVVKVDFSLKNRDRKPRLTSLWKHLTAQFTPGAKDIILVPAKSGVSRVGNRAVMEFSENVIYHDFDSSHQSSHIAPLAPWIGRCSSDGVNRGTLVMSAEKMMGPGAFHFTWKSPGLPLHTAEMILPPKDLAPGETENYTIYYRFFPHLAAVRALDGDTAFNAVAGFLELESVRAAAPAELTLYRLDGKQEILLGKYQVPALEAGELFRIAIDKNIDVDNTVLVVNWNNKKIILHKVKK